MPPSRSKKHAALAKFKAAKERRLQGTEDAASALDGADTAADAQDDDDMYEYLEEADYQKLVNDRREREDFVVDDDGLGYYDDGEERFGNEAEENEATSKKRTASATATLTQQALKKARKTAQAARANAADNAAARADAASQSNKSMWEFVNRGASTATATSAAASSRKPAVTAKNVDALLEQLDEPMVKKSAAGQRNRRSGARGARGARSARRAPRPVQQQRSRIQFDQDDADNDQDDDFVSAFDDDHDEQEHEQPSAVDSPQAGAKEPPVAPNSTSSGKSVTFAQNVKSPTKSGNDTTTTAMDTSTTDNETAILEEEPTKEPAAPRRRLARPKLGQISAPAKQAAAVKESTKKTAQAQPKIVPTVDATAASFQPTNIAAEAPSGPASSTAGQLDLASIVVTPPPQAAAAAVDGDGDTVMDARKAATAAAPYVDMFWTDLQEKNGTVFLFGKVAHGGKFVSACAVVTGNVRNLFVLPKKNADGTPHSMLEVHQETNTVMRKGIIPHTAGASWAGKAVKRQYAFEDTDVPREETEYLKVVYDAKYPVPSEDVCSFGGEHFSKILGAGASVKENFIVKRKLMGPCWVRIRQPIKSNAPMSWCKVEFKVDNPKNITRLDLEEDGASRPAPPVVTMSIKIKTVVNAKTHKSEIVSISALCHKNVMLEGASDESPKHMVQLSLIRPLGEPGATGLPQFPRDIDAEIAAGMPQLRRETNERAMLSRLFAQIGQWDPDVLVGHNAWGYDMEVLLTRCIELKVMAWSKIGRRRKTQLPNKAYFASRKDFAIADAVAGRLLCDTYLSAKELLRETTYSLTNLAATQLKTSRQEIEPVDIPQWFNSSKTIVQLALSTSFDVQLVQRLMFKLQVLPLSKQLTCIAGNIWSHTLKSNRAERTEYLLLHEFRRLKFLPPDKRRPGKRDNEKSKAKFSGGLVLEPKKGLYDSFILLLDFNSLYPSIIQEYNLCFTTLDWSKYAGGEVPEGENAAASNNLPPLPDESVKCGVLPRVIKSLVERRRAVKKMMKSEKNPEKKRELDIRQTALKLTANSMYGCLGFSHSRFFAQPIAAMVTAMGRETLQRTVDIAQNTVGLDVIYGDTDSIMINTRINDESELSKVYELGERVKREVNRLYRTLELEVDGIFRSMLLLKKKKYAAKTVLERLPDGTVKYGQELKGLDLVRRDWCIQSKDTGRYVTDQILSGQDSELVVLNIHTHLEELATKMRNEELPLEKYVITKGLSKHPNEYPDGKSLPHVQVAKGMLKNNRPVNTGDHIPYVITAPIAEEGSDKPKATTSTERARHPEEIARSNGVLKPDVEWYLTQQILPPIGRLCEPIEGTSQSILAEKLGLDTARYNQSARSSAGIDDDDLIDYIPASSLADAERFKDVEKLKLFCLSCNVEGVFPGVFHTEKDVVTGSQNLVSGLRCTNPDCLRPNFWGHANHFECYARISNTVSIWVRGLKCKYYEGLVRCDEPSCGLETRQLSVAGGICLRRGCNGRFVSVDSERDMHTHLKYLETLFHADHACKQLEKKETFGRKSDLMKTISKHDKATFDELHTAAEKTLSGSAFNWISPSFWKGMFDVGAKQ